MAGDERDGRILLASLLAFAAIAAAVRVGFLFVPMRGDEAVTFVSYASHPWREAISNYALPNNHLLNTLAAHFAWRLLGNEPWILRLPALLTGIAAVPAAFLLARELYGRQAALWGAALVAGSSGLIQYSTNGRGYMPGTLFVLLAAFCGSRAERTGRPLAWAGFGIWSVLAVYSVPSMSLGVAIVAAWIALNTIVGSAPGERFRASLPTLRALVVVLVLVAVASVALYAPTFGDPGWSPTPDVVPRATTLHEKWLVARDVWGLFNDGLPRLIKLLILGAFVLGLVRHRRLADHEVPLAAVALALVLLGAALTHPPVFARTLIELLPVYLITAGAGLALLTRRLLERLGRGQLATGVTAALTVTVASALAVTFAARGDDAVRRDPPRSDPGVSRLKQRLLPRAPLLASPVGALGAGYYFDRDGVTGLVSDTDLPGYASKISAAQRRAGHVAVLVINREEDPKAVAAAAGLTPRPGIRPRLLKRYPWVSVYQVETAR